MMKIDFNYLDSLIKEVKELRNSITFCEIDAASCSFTYMPTKKTSFVGYKQGYYDELTKSEKGMSETDKLRATVKEYLKFIRSKDDKLLQIEKHSNGRIDCLHQVYWAENKRYLFPFSASGGYYPTYTYVTQYEGEAVVEEYMVDGNQIIYEVYSHISETEIDCYCVNYISGGNYPVREEKEGKLDLNTLTYEETNYDCWLNHR